MVTNLRVKRKVRPLIQCGYKYTVYLIAATCTCISLSASESILLVFPFAGTMLDNCFALFYSTLTDNHEATNQPTPTAPDAITVDCGIPSCSAAIRS